MKKLTLILALSLTVGLAAAQRRALRVLPAEAREIVELEKAVMRSRTAVVVSNAVASVIDGEIATLKTNALRVTDGRIKFEDYALKREGGTNTTADIQAARLKILEVQSVD